MPNLQEERSAETRRRLLDAAVACLYERGYAGTTTVEISNRAGVSRGAQLHHFPTKEELVVKALEYVFDLRTEELRALIAEMPAGDPISRLHTMIDLLWPVFKGPTFYAWLELVVASRTDPALRQPVLMASKQLGERVRAGFAKVLEWPSGREQELHSMVGLIFGQLEALALERELLADTKQDPPEFVEAINCLKRLATSIFESERSGSATK